MPGRRTLGSVAYMKIGRPTLAALLVLLALSLASCGDDDSESSGGGPSTDTSADTAPSDDATTGGVSDSDGSEDGDSGGSDDLAAIVVDSPSPDDTVTSPVTISGTANVFEANVSIEITNADGTALAATFTTASCGSGCRGEFSEDVGFVVDDAQQGLITVFESSAKDGSRQNVVKIPVTLEP